MSALDMIKENPGLAVGGAAVVVLLFSMRGGSNVPSTSTMINAQLQAQKTASATDVAISGINAKAASERTAQLAGIYKAQIVSGAQLAATKDTNSAKVNLGVAGINANQQIANATITSKQNMAAMGINAQMQALQSNNDLARYGIDVTSANMPQILASRQLMAQISGSNMAALASMNGQTAQAIAAINGQNSLAIANVNTSASRTNAQTAQNSASSKDDMDWLSTAVGIGSMFFSDIRLKTDIVKLYDRPDGLGVYSYRYVGDSPNSEKTIGVMAQEVEKVYPDAVHTMSNGFKAVDYSVI